MTRIGTAGRMLMVALVGLLVVLVASGPALADKVHLKDGRVIEGTIEREIEGTGVWVVVTHGRISNTHFYTSDQIAKVEREEKSGGAAAAATAKPSRPSAPAARDGSTRVAVLNFGPPSSWQGVIDNTVGIQIGVNAFEDAIPLLEKDGVNVVVVRINSGGGLALEVPKFLKLFEEKYKPRFRTVAWVESAISAAAMSPYCLEEFYFMPEGNLGACTAFSGALNAAKDLNLEIYLSMMEEASRKGKRDPKIMRAMQIMEPLSARIDENGDVHWFQDLSGDYVLNPERQVFTITAKDAVRFKFARAEAATLEELCRAMGLQEWTIAGQKATELVDNAMRAADRTEKKLDEVYTKYMMAVEAARALGGEQNRQRRGAEVGRARRYLADIKQMFSVNPNFALLRGLPDDWFEQQERMLRDLMR